MRVMSPGNLEPVILAYTSSQFPANNLSMLMIKSASLPRLDEHYFYFIVDLTFVFTILQQRIQRAALNVFLGRFTIDIQQLVMR